MMVGNQHSKHPTLPERAFGYLVDFNPHTIMDADVISEH